MPVFYIKGKFSFRRTLELKVPAGSGHVSDQFGCHSFWGIFDIFLPEFVYVFLIHLGSLLSVINTVWSKWEKKSSRAGFRIKAMLYHSPFI